MAEAALVEVAEASEEAAGAAATVAVMAAATVACGVAERNRVISVVFRTPMPRRRA